MRGGSCLGAAGLLTAVAPWPVRAAGSGSPDVIVINANVYTVDDSMPQAQAFAIKDGRFMVVGTTADIKALAGSQTQSLDAQGMTVFPGFIDCHNHAPGTRLLNDVIVGNPYEVEFVTIDGIIDKLKARASTTPPGAWVEGQFFDDTKVKDGRELNVHDLDKVSLDHPVVVNHRGAHSSFYNSKALQLAGITKNTPSQASGTYDKGPDGELNGRVTDLARSVFAKVGQRPGLTPEQSDAGAKVVVLGQTVTERLFGANSDPTGQTVRIQNVSGEIQLPGFFEFAVCRKAAVSASPAGRFRP